MIGRVNQVMLAGAGCALAIVAAPSAAAAPLPTGGPVCAETVELAALPCAPAAPVVPHAAAVAAAGGLPGPPLAPPPPVPLAPPPVVPPVPPLAPPVPVVPLAPPVAAAAPAAVPGAVLADAPAPAGKGVPTNPSPDDVPDLVVLPGPPLS